MIFKDRRDAGRKLLVKLYEDHEIKKYLKKVIVVSLLRGGILVGDVIAKGLQVKHLPLVVTKISAPYSPELAIGALCFDIVYLEKEVVSSLRLERSTTRQQIEIAKEKFDSYCKKFGIKKSLYSRNLQNKIVILVDDGIATGSTSKVAILFLNTKKPKSIILALPVAPKDILISGVDKQIIFYKDANFRAVSQYYKTFKQVEDKDVKQLLQFNKS